MGWSGERLGLKVRSGMNRNVWTILLILLCAYSPGLAATKQNDRPDKEMLRLMEFLRNWEMIKEMEIMQNLQSVEQGNDLGSNTASEKSSPGTKKEGLK